MKRKIVLYVSAVALIIAMGVGFTLAYFTDEDSATNTFTVGDVDIDLDEPGWDPEEGENLLPGDTLVKDPVITAASDSEPSYMRVKVEFKDSNGQIITDSERNQKILDTVFYDKDEKFTAGTSYATTDTVGIPKYNTASFKDGSAELVKAGVGYFTYTNADTKDIFYAGDEVVLFNKIVIPSDWDSEDIELLGSYQIVITAEAIQADGFENSDAAWEAFEEQKQNAPSGN